MSSFAVCFNFHSLFPNQPTIHWPLQCNLFRIFFFSFPGMHALCNVAHCIRDRLRIAPALNFYICFFNWPWWVWAKRCHIDNSTTAIYIYFCSIFWSFFTWFICFYFGHIHAKQFCFANIWQWMHKIAVSWQNINFIYHSKKKCGAKRWRKRIAPATRISKINSRLC